MTLDGLKVEMMTESEDKMSGHTEGKWKIDDRVRYSINVGNKHIAMVNVYNAVEPERRIDCNEGLANARLIAAAPELLAACDEGLHECERAKMHCSCPDKDLGGLLKRIERIEAAIANTEKGK